MFFVSILQLFPISGNLVLILVVLSLALVGFLLQFRLCKARAPMPLRLLPTVLPALALLLLLSVQLGWIYLSLPTYHLLVTGGLMSIWGACMEGFLAGCLLGWITRLIDRNIKRG